MGDKGRLAIALVVLSVACSAVVLLRATGAPDLCDNAQAKQAAYAVDLYYNGNWVLQHDHDGSVQTKPPAYNWLVGLFAVARGRLDTLALYAPCALSFVGLVLSAALFAQALYGRADAAVLAGVAVMASSLGVKLAWLARTDTMFAFLTWSCFLAGYGAFRRPRLWVLFWMLAAAATLTKGPLSLLFAFIGLAGAWRCSGSAVRFGCSFWLGAVLFAGLTLGWLAAAVTVGGAEVVHTLLGRELAQHALFGVEWRVPFANFYKPPLSFVARLAPWSILATAGVVHALRRRALDAPLVALAAYVYGGVALLMVSPHHRADHLAPLIPGVAVLSVLPFVRWRGLAEKRLALRIASGSVFVLAVAGGYGYYHWVRPAQVQVQRTAVVRQAAIWLARSGDRRPAYAFHATGALDWYAREAGRTVGVAPCRSLPPPADCQYLVTLRPDLVDPVLGREDWRRLPFGSGRRTKGTLVIYERTRNAVARKRADEDVPQGANRLR